MKNLQLKNLKEEKFYVYVILSLICTVLTSIPTVSGECSNGFEEKCEWFQDRKSALKWTSKTDAEGKNKVQLTDCKYPNCGIGMITTPWLEPRDQSETISFSYKIYGTSETYLRLYMISADGGNGQHQIFSLNSRYTDPFPESWTTTDVQLPAVSSKHRLLLKAYIPYKEAYIAVKDILLSDDIFVTIDFDDSMYDENKQDVLEVQKKKNIEEEWFQALEVDFYGSEDITKGYTKVMDPNICRYR